jgi:uncharacterized protein
LWGIGAVITAYLGLCLWIYGHQAGVLFQPLVLDKTFKFSYKTPFIESYYQVDANRKLNSLLFKANRAKGVVFYLHGSGGNLTDLDNLPALVTENQYDLLAVDYRGFGKSEGPLSTEKQYLEDASIIYNDLKKRYKERNMIIYGYSFGTGIATYLASTNANNSGALILEAPFKSYQELLKEQFPAFLPSWLISDYKFETDESIKKVKCPIYLFHGIRDKNIDYSASLELTPLNKNIVLFTIADADHFSIKQSNIYLTQMHKILSR